MVGCISCCHHAVSVGGGLILNLVPITLGLLEVGTQDCIRFYFQLRVRQVGLFVCLGMINANDGGVGNLLRRNGSICGNREGHRVFDLSPKFGHPFCRMP